MGRLRRLPGRLGQLAPTLGRAATDAGQAGGPGRDRVRDAAAPWRRWYKTARWQRLRWSVLVRAVFTCAACQRVEGNTALLVADHIEPHRGDEAKFWNEANLQCLCKACHDGAKQREEWGR
jgi:5-methylcytosine-specific restriction endonuclease McrA